MSGALRVEGIHAGYGKNEVLHGVSLSVPAGAKVALLGANGAGKSTLLKILSNLHQPLSGKVFYNDALINGLPTEKVVSLGIVQVPEGRRVFANLTVAENLRMAAIGARKNYRSNLGRVFSTFPILAERREQAAGLLSGGQQQMLALSRAIMAEPELVLLDEMSLGLAPILVKELYSRLDEIFDPGTSMLIVEQNARVALSAVDYVYILRNGLMAAEGTPDTYRDSEELLHAGYFGG